MNIKNLPPKKKFSPSRLDPVVTCKVMAVA